MGVGERGWVARGLPVVVAMGLCGSAACVTRNADSGGSAEGTSSGADGASPDDGDVLTITQGDPATSSPPSSSDSGDGDTGGETTDSGGDTGGGVTGSVETTGGPLDPCLHVPDDMVCVPAGSFWMGCNSALDDLCEDGERPYHEVVLDAYWIDVFEVTVEKYTACVAAGGCRDIGMWDDICNWVYDNRDDHPMNCMQWQDAGDYCAWADRRLPTEAEWEKAARGVDERVHPWGNEPPSCEYAVMRDNTSGCNTSNTMSVGSRPAGVSPYGAHDMIGNVYEFVADHYAEDYYEMSPLENPTGPLQGAAVIRGGGFNYLNPVWLRASYRGTSGATYASDHSGFRCAKTP